jgi:hypothetical protein
LTPFGPKIKLFSAIFIPLRNFKANLAALRYPTIQAAKRVMGMIVFANGAYEARIVAKMTPH